MVGIEGKITWRKNLMKYKEYKELYGTKNFKMLTFFNTKNLDISVFFVTLHYQIKKQKY